MPSRWAQMISTRRSMDLTTSSSRVSSNSSFLAGSASPTRMKPWTNFRIRCKNSRRSSSHKMLPLTVQESSKPHVAGWDPNQYWSRHPWLFCSPQVLFNNTLELLWQSCQRHVGGPQGCKHRGKNSLAWLNTSVLLAKAKYITAIVKLTLCIVWNSVTASALFWNWTQIRVLENHHHRGKKNSLLRNKNVWLLP